LDELYAIVEYLSRIFRIQVGLKTGEKVERWDIEREIDRRGAQSAGGGESGRVVRVDEAPGGTPGSSGVREDTPGLSGVREVRSA